MFIYSIPSSHNIKTYRNIFITMVRSHKLTQKYSFSYQQNFCAPLLSLNFDVMTA